MARRRRSGALERGQLPGVQGAAPGRRREGTAHTSAGASHTPRAPAAPGCPRRAPHPPASLRGSGSAEPEGPRPRRRRARGGGESPGRPGRDALGGFAGFPGPLFSAAELSPRPPHTPLTLARCSTRGDWGEESQLLSDDPEYPQGRSARVTRSAERIRLSSELLQLCLGAVASSIIPAFPGLREKPGGWEP